MKSFEDKAKKRIVQKFTFDKYDILTKKTFTEQ